MRRGDATERVLLMGHTAVAWSEGHPRARCPCGCHDRDLDDERAKQFDRLCLRCLTWTWDLPGWDAPKRREVLALVAEAEDSARGALAEAALPTDDLKLKALRDRYHVERERKMQEERRKLEHFDARLLVRLPHAHRSRRA